MTVATLQRISSSVKAGLPGYVQFYNIHNNNEVVHIASPDTPSRIVGELAAVIKAICYVLYRNNAAASRPPACSRDQIQKLITQVLPLGGKRDIVYRSAEAFVVCRRARLVALLKLWTIGEEEIRLEMRSGKRTRRVLSPIYSCTTLPI